MKLLKLLPVLLALGGTVPAFAADQNPPAKTAVPVKAAPVPAAPSNLYIGAWAGAGFSKTENELTLSGTAQGPVSAYPTGIMPGLTLGYASNGSPVVWGFAVDIGYDFSRGDVASLTPGTTLGFRKNGFFIDEVGEIGISASTVGGYIPSNAQPQNWAVPITVPASVWSNLIFAARGGFAQRNVTLCASDATLTGECASKFINGPLFGAKVKAMLSGNTEIFATVDEILWNSSFTPSSATPVFANTTAAKRETLFRLGFGYHFTGF